MLNLLFLSEILVKNKIEENIIKINKTISFFSPCDIVTLPMQAEETTPLPSVYDEMFSYMETSIS